MTAAVTVFPNQAMETDKTDKTDKTDLVGNHDFLRAVFGEQLNDNRPIIVSFTGNPATVAKSVWFGQPWQDHLVMPSHANN